MMPDPTPTPDAPAPDLKRLAYIAETRKVYENWQAMPDTWDWAGPKAAVRANLTEMAFQCLPDLFALSALRAERDEAQPVSDGAIYAAASRKNVPDAVIDEAAAEVRAALTPVAPAGDREAVSKLTSAETAPEHLDDDQADAWVDGWNACVAALSRARTGSEGVS